MINGFIKIDKETDFTSKDVDKLIKKELDLPKDGHLGTLDPFATGLLIVAINEATKVLPLIKDEEKEYIATLKLGETTDSLDITGKVTATKEVPLLTRESINDVFKSFLGETLQVPPEYCARHINGIRAYKLVRKGDEVNLPPSTVNISKLDLLLFDNKNKEITFLAKVSKGTYIRSLGRDIAVKLGTLGYLKELRRISIGKYDLINSVKVKNVTYDSIIPIEQFVPDTPVIELKGKDFFTAKNGGPLTISNASPYIFLKGEGKLLAIYQKKGKQFISYKGFQHD